jgi:hypothetical protein
VVLQAKVLGNMPAQVDTEIKYPENREHSERSRVMTAEADKAHGGGTSDYQ